MKGRMWTGGKEQIKLRLNQIMKMNINSNVFIIFDRDTEN